MPPSRTVAPYSPPKTIAQPRAVPRHRRHPPPFIPVTNAIEALNRQLRKAIKTKGHFPNEDAARKLIYLAVANAVPAWTRTRNWTAALLAFKIHVADRLPNQTN
jgi:transposase-like protein